MLSLFIYKVSKQSLVCISITYLSFRGYNHSICYDLSTVNNQPISIVESIHFSDTKFEIHSVVLMSKASHESIFSLDLMEFRKTYHLYSCNRKQGALAESEVHQNHVIHYLNRNLILVNCYKNISYLKSIFVDI